MHPKYIKGSTITTRGPQSRESNATIPDTGSVFSQRSDPEVWRSFLDDDMGAFIFIYNKYFRVLYNYGHKLCGDDDLIKDCIHDVFVRIKETRSRLGEVRNIKYYLLKCFKTRFLYYRRKRYFCTWENRDYSEQSFGFSLSAEQKIIDAQLDSEKIERLNRAIRQLTAHQREAIYYYYYESFTLDEIREIMQAGSRRTVQNLIYRAVASLRKVLVCMAAIIAVVL